MTGKQKKALKRNAIGYSFILPNFIGYFIFIFVPIILTFVLCVMKWDGSSAPMEFVGLKNFTEVQYEKYMAQKEKEEEEKMRKKDEPYKGMKEKYINITLLGRAKEKRTEHYWRDTPGKRTQDIQYRYMWYNSNGTKKFMAVCRNGRVSSVVEFVPSTASRKNSYSGNTSRNNTRKDMYDVQDYDDPEDFYYDHADEFDDIQDAEDYWEEAQ